MITDKLKFGLLMYTGGPFGTPQILASLAEDAEKAGWDGYFIWDSIGPTGVNPWISLAAISLATKKIKIGAMVTAIPRRRPWDLAKEAIAIDQLSNGRLIFGAGLGDEAIYTSFGEETSKIIRAKKLDEGLDIITKLWSGEKINYSGKYYQIKDLQFTIRPIQSPRIPIWTGGLWPNKGPFRRAAKWEGIMPHTVRSITPGEQLTVEEVRDLMTYIKKHRKGSMDDFQLAMLSNTTQYEDKEPSEIITPFLEHGMTWWCESVFEWPFSQSLEKVKDHICRGPPSI